MIRIVTLAACIPAALAQSSEGTLGSCTHGEPHAHDAAVAQTLLQLASASGRQLPTATDTTHGVTQALQARRVNSAVELEPHQSLPAVWASVLSLDPACGEEGTLAMIVMYRVAVRSSIAQGNDKVFVPHLLMHMPPRMSIAALGADIHRALQGLEALGVQLVPFVSRFYEPYKEVIAHMEDRNRHVQERAKQNVTDIPWQCVIGTYARIDVPNVLYEMGILSNGKYNSTHGMYTDVDILWMEPVSFNDWLSLAPTNGCQVSLGLDVNDPDHIVIGEGSNAGVMVFNAQAYVTAKVLDRALEYGELRKWMLPAYDQSLLNYLFDPEYTTGLDMSGADVPLLDREAEARAGVTSLCMTKLGAEWNYKPWWGASLGTPKMLHLQGYHPSTELYCYAMQERNADELAKTMGGMSTGVASVQRQIVSYYQKFGTNLLKQGLLLYYSLLDQAPPSCP